MLRGKVTPIGQVIIYLTGDSGCIGDNDGISNTKGTGNIWTGTGNTEGICN